MPLKKLVFHISFVNLLCECLTGKFTKQKWMNILVEKHQSLYIFHPFEQEW